MSKNRSLMICLGVYALALVVAAVIVWVMSAYPVWVRIGVADLVATLIVFRGSVTINNSSLYDPYWSVAPLAIAGYLFMMPVDTDVTRSLIVVVVIGLWGVRLTLNWVRRWGGVGDEDWRYVNLRTSTRQWYWLASLFGLHLVPTLVVFLGCAGAYAALHVGSQPWGWLDSVATALALVAVSVETIADEQLRRFLRRPHPAGSILTTGLWSWSRHPNYFGELAFWWAVALFGVSAAPEAWWVWLGPLAMTVLFACISLPLIERRRQRKPEWAGYAQRTSLLVPWPPRSTT